MDFNNHTEISSIIDRLRRLRQGCIRPIVFITGLSGSGKTTLASKLRDASDEIIVISFDWWIKDASPLRRAKIVDDYEKTGDIPNPLEWYDWQKFHDDMNNLQSTGKLIFHRAWNQTTGEKDLDLELQVGHDGIIVIEGMYLFEDLTRTLANYIIMIEPDIDKATQRAQARHQQRNPGDYLAIKERWHREYDVSYLKKHAEKVHLLISNDD